MQFTAEMIAGLLEGTVVGDKGATVSTVTSIDGGKAGGLAYLTNPKYEQYLYTTQASIVLVDSTFEPKAEVRTTLIKVKNVGECVLRLLEMYNAARPRKSGISPQASISEEASVGEECYIGQFTVVERGANIGRGVQLYPQCYIGDGVTIGEGTILYPGVKVYEGCTIGRNCILHAGAVIGADGFGFAPREDGTFAKIPQLGNVIIEDNVEIGANTCIDRATMGATIIKRGVKLDNMVQVAHNVVIDEHTVMAAQCGVAGSTKVGSWCMVGGQTGISGHIQIGNQVKVGGHSAISNSVKDGKAVMGYPAFDHTQFARATVVFKKLPEMYREMDALKKEIETLKQQLADGGKA